MLRTTLAIAALCCATWVVADEEPVRASIIDSETDRIPLHTVAPEYPRKARRDRIEGEVMVCFDIDRHGRPRRIAVRRSTGRQFEKPSLRAVRASSFRPLEDDEPLQTLKTCRTFVFALVPLQNDRSD